MTAASADAWAAVPPDGLCLDFANTLYWRGSTPPTETLHAPADLLDWCAAAGLVDGGTLARLRARWAADPRVAAAAFTAAVGLREALFRLFAAAAGGTVTDAADMAAFNALLGVAPARTRLHAEGAGYVWALAVPAPSLGVLLAPILWSAGDLLAGARRTRLRQCANPHCRYLFLDDSKSANRRWCSMATCGNRAKAHRHYVKARQAP